MEEYNKFSPTSTFNQMLMQARADDITFEEFRKRIESKVFACLWDEKSKAEIFSYLDKTIADSKVKARTVESNNHNLGTVTINVDGSQLDELSENMSQSQREIEKIIQLLDEANTKSKILQQCSKEFNIPYEVLKKESSEFEKNFGDVTTALLTEKYSELQKENIKRVNAAMHVIPFPLLSWPEINEEKFPFIKLEIDNTDLKLNFNFNGYSEEKLFEVVDGLLEAAVKQLTELQKGKTYGDAVRALEKIDRETKGSSSYKERTYASIARESKYILEDKMRMKSIK